MPVRPPCLCAALVMAAMLAGCAAPTTRVVLLPQANQAPSAVIITAADVAAPQTSVVLDKPYATAVVLANHQVDTEQSDAKAVDSRYKQILQATPSLPERYTLHFQHGTSSLTPDSLSELDGILSRALAWAGSDIIITGHTDRVGSMEANDQLSLQRALAIRELVLLRGFDPSRVMATGRGEREPLVPTEDGVPESRNRRAEITVR